MKFNVVFEIYPPGIFGVPEIGKTVFPTEKSKDFLGDTIHFRTMSRVVYGTISQYRQETEAIDLPLEFGTVKGRIKDNFIFLEVEGDTVSEAYQTATETLDTFLQHLVVSTRNSFSSKTLYIEPENKELCQTPRSATSISATFYNLQQLQTDIQEAQRFFELKDIRLERALKYYEHSVLLFDKRASIAEPSSRHYRYLIASVFLNLWKAVSTVVGDPARRNDHFQKRYKEIGLDKSYKPKIDLLKKLRDEYDVAHYSLSDDSLTEIEKSFREAQDIAADVMQQYRKFLSNEKGSIIKNELFVSGE